MKRLRTVYKKILRELWRDRGRTLMVALSVAVGVLGVGLIVATGDFLLTDLYRRYADIHPAHIALSVPGGVTDDDLKGLSKVPGVADVQGRATYIGRYLDTAGQWQSMEFVAFPDPTAQTVNIIDLEAGQWPDRRQTALERTSMDDFGVAIGEPLVVEANDREVRLTITGRVHQQDNLSTAVRGVALVVVDRDTMTQLRGHDRIDTIYLTTTELSQQAAIAATAQQRLERAGYTVGKVSLKDPAVHPAQDTLDPLLLLMGALGVLALLLSGVLVTNTMGALVAQQTGQIGVMKAVGADAGVIRRVYNLNVLIYGLLGMVIGAPLANRLGYQLATYLATQLNIDLFARRVSWPALGVMVVVGLVVPFIAAGQPLAQGARLTVREAISDHGLSDEDNPWVRFLGRVHGLSRIWALALRNSVRVPTRLMLTLVTLALGGGIFMAVLSTNASLNLTLDKMIEDQSQMDLLIGLENETRIHRVVPLIASYPGVAQVEAWHFEQVVMQTPSGQEVDVRIFAGPADTALYTPELTAGRWFVAGQGNEIVVNHKWAVEEHIDVGDTVLLDIADKETAWTVVGVNLDMRSESTGVYLALEDLDRILHRTDRTVTLQVEYIDQDPAHQPALSNELVAALEQQGISVYSTISVAQLKERVHELYRVLISFLLVMSALIALVGGLALMGMMSINVLERRKEIGVMRAVGAENRAIVQIFWGESMVVALSSFVVAVVVSIPLGLVLSHIVGVSFMDRSLDFTYAFQGIVYWLGIVVMIGTLASIVPALNAAKLSVRESLSYE